MTDSSASSKPVSPVSDTAGERQVIRGWEVWVDEHGDFNVRHPEHGWTTFEDALCDLVHTRFLTALASPAVTPAEEGSADRRG